MSRAKLWRRQPARSSTSWPHIRVELRRKPDLDHIPFPSGLIIAHIFPPPLRGRIQVGGSEPPLHPPSQPPPPRGKGHQCSAGLFQEHLRVRLSPLGEGMW